VGTSKSSSGAPAGAPLVPPWVPDAVPPPDGASDGDGDEGGDDQQQQPPPLPVPGAAPRARFAPARTSLGRFAGSGSANDMRRGVGHYVGKGLGGSSAAAQRFGGTARTAGALYGALSSFAAGQAAPGSPLDSRILTGRSASDVMDAVVEAVRPVDGTQDAEASRKAIRDSLSDLLAQFPTANLLNLAEDQRIFAIEHFIAADVFNRIILDVGKTLNEKAPNAPTALSRMKQIRDYVRETIAARFRALRKSASSLSARVIARLASQAMREAFGVFEDYVK
jgi:hypothetical protein